MEKLKRREDMKREERNGYVSLSLSLSLSLSPQIHPLHAMPSLLSRLPNANQKPHQKQNNSSKNVSNAKESKPTKNVCKNSTNTCPPCPSIMICLALDLVKKRFSGIQDRRASQDGHILGCPPEDTCNDGNGEGRVGVSLGTSNIMCW